MKTLKTAAVKVWNTVIAAIGWLINLLLILLPTCCILGFFSGILTFGLGLWFNHDRMAYWIITGIMWFGFGFGIWLAVSGIRGIYLDITIGNDPGSRFIKKMTR